jgi:hypothetical protein
MEAKTNGAHPLAGVGDDSDTLEDNGDMGYDDVLVSSNRVAIKSISAIRHYQGVASSTDPSLKTFEFQRATYVGQIPVGRSDWDGSDALKPVVDGSVGEDDAKEGADDVVAPHLADPLPRTRADSGDPRCDSKGRSDSFDGAKGGGGGGGDKRGSK